MKNKILLFILFFYPLILLAQWQNMGYGFDNVGRVMYYDTTDNLLYVGGNFYHSDSIVTNHTAVWDGTHWDSLGFGAPYASFVYSLTKYQGRLYASSLFYNYPIGMENNLAWWNGQYWDTLNEKINDAIHIFKEYNNELYLGGSFTKVGNLNANGLAKYDGTNFSSFPFPMEAGDRVLAIEFFQGQMYVGGNIYDTLTGVYDLERWDGISFQPFGGGGLMPGGDIVSALEVYNNELYIGGWFTTNEGNPANYIMRWDGTQYRDVGGGLDGQVFKMHVFNGELYVCGTFSMAGGVPASRIAKWNGSQWSTVCPPFTTNGVGDFTIHNNVLYLTGSFSFIDSIQMNYVAMYTGVNSVLEVPEEPQIFISPNPANIKLNIINFKIKIEKQTIIDILGNKVYSEENNELSHQIDISFLSNGLYFLVLETEKGKVVKKFVKE